MAVPSLKVVSVLLYKNRRFQNTAEPSGLSLPPAWNATGAETQSCPLMGGTALFGLGKQVGFMDSRYLQQRGLINKKKGNTRGYLQTHGARQLKCALSRRKQPLGVRLTNHLTLVKTALFWDVNSPNSPRYVRSVAVAMGDRQTYCVIGTF